MNGNFPCVRRTRNYGFTLIEVLIAMTLLSVMVMLLFGSLRICAQSWQLGEDKISIVNETAVVHNFFKQYLGSARPLWDDAGTDTNAGKNNQKLRTLSFQGERHAVQFVSSFPASTGRSGLQLFLVEATIEEGEQIVKVTLTPFFPVSENGAWQQEEAILIKNVNGFSLSYFGYAENGSGIWLDEWRDQATQPNLVKISIDTDDGAYWPEMLIELKVQEVDTIAASTKPDNKPKPDPSNNPFLKARQ